MFLPLAKTIRCLLGSSTIALLAAGIFVGCGGEIDDGSASGANQTSTQGASDLGNIDPSALPPQAFAGGETSSDRSMSMLPNPTRDTAPRCGVSHTGVYGASSCETSSRRWTVSRQFATARCHRQQPGSYARVRWVSTCWTYTYQGKKIDAVTFDYQCCK